jgi:hypothetical protein
MIAVSRSGLASWCEHVCDPPWPGDGRLAILHGQDLPEPECVYRQQQEMQAEHRGEPSEKSVRYESDIAEDGEDAQQAHVLGQEGQEHHRRREVPGEIEQCHPGYCLRQVPQRKCLRPDEAQSNRIP